ncbi:YrrS family protein [Sporosarcina sp. BP05]|uniref:YrrS family protein n=1 Tax=Sporosarcina sp. BP05 TaxID=2758726 RepID=UPI0021053F01|nr:YrrS family protein [Sporosarcina sp. BP05]
MEQISLLLVNYILAVVKILIGVDMLMTEREPDLSRVERKKGRNRNKVLNSMIAVVVVLIVVATVAIFSGNKSDKEPSGIEETANGSPVNEDVAEDVKDDDKDNGIEDSKPTSEEETSEPANTIETDKADETTTGDDSDEPSSVTSVPSDDAIIAETVTDTAWKPIGTTQTGEHVSLYDVKSVDWNEKKQALAYATGLSQDSMIFWKIKNGGGPQKSIGIVSSRDSSQKYRVYLEWVDGEGWKPVKMDKLTTLDFKY